MTIILVVAIPVAVLAFAVGNALGFRSGQRNERERSSRRVVALMEVRRAIEKAVAR